jgi:tetratricopeptide (TPR) repeat protein
MLKKLNIATRLVLAVVLAAALLGVRPGYADTRDADLVKQGTDALKHREYDVAVERFSAAIRLVPDDAEASGKRGEAYAAKGKSRNAVADCAQAVKLAPSSSEAYGRCGYVYFHANDFERAIEAYSTVIKLDPRHASAYSSRGLSYSLIGQTDRAISDYDTVIQLDPSQSDVYVLRGNAWLQKGDLDRAWADYNRAIQADPRNAYAYVSRGYAAASQYAYDDAISDYDQAIKVDPTYKDAYRYRDLALERKRDSRWGYVYLVLFGVGMLALLFAAFWTYISPTAFTHTVERHFNRTPDGRLIYHPTIKGAGYIVPDAQREQALRLFTKHSQSGTLAFGVLGPVLMSALTVLVMLGLTPLRAQLGISTSAAILISSFGSVALILAGGLLAFSLRRRAAVRGLIKASEKGAKPRFDQWIDDITEDMPVAVRWIALAMVLFVSYKSVQGLWQILHGFPIPIRGIPTWLLVGGNLLVLWYCGKLLAYAVRQRNHRTGQIEGPA